MHCTNKYINVHKGRNWLINIYVNVINVLIINVTNIKLQIHIMEYMQS